MKIFGALAAAGISIAAFAAFRSAALAASRPAAPADPAPSAGGPVVERGRYLVHDVALCIQCHSPRDENGNLIETKLLTGARIPFDSPFPGQAWAYQAPNIRGMIG